MYYLIFVEIWWQINKNYINYGYNLKPFNYSKLKTLYKIGIYLV